MVIDMSARFVGVDWGTSNRRAYVYGAGGAVLRQADDGQGMLASRGRFASALDELLVQLEVPPETPVLMSGMVGSAQGWQEAPYLDPQVPLLDLSAHLMHLDGARSIVPGYRQREGLADVMRGEETQLLGLVLNGLRDGWVVLPGTHCKWVNLKNGCIERWSTYMTGEIFAMLSRSGTLAPLLEGGADVAEAFEAGLALARRGLPLTNTLFSVRAGVVGGTLPAARASSLVSGLLIGSEFVAMAASGHAGDEITLLASLSLCVPYQRAARSFGITATVADSHALYASAMRHLYQEGKNHAA